MKKTVFQITGSRLVEFIPNATNTLNAKRIGSINRPVDEAQVKILMDSFVRFGVASLTIIIIRTKAFKGTYELYIGDGQHSAEACNRLGIPFDIKVIELFEDTKLEVTQYIATLNNSNKAWSTTNYLNAYCDNGIPEYIKAVKVIAETGLTVTDFEYIYLGSGGGKEHKSFKNGTMKFPNEADSDKLLEAIMMVKPHVPNKAYVRRSLFKVMRMTNDYQKLAKVIIKASIALAENETSFSENEKEFLAHLIKLNAKYCKA
jgi:hypothetical protein